MSKRAMTYARAGVNIDAGNDLVTDIRKLARQTPQRGVVSGIGGFAAIFDSTKRLQGRSYLVSSTDGVGTKLELAVLRGEHRTIGIDLVAMSVNDLITVGAEPLFFLDYYATGHLKPQVARDVLSGIAKGCKISNCTLIGGETAEMPGIYANGIYDLAGFAVGVVSPHGVPRPKSIKVGDAIVGLASSGVHSNGYSLVRKIFSRRELKGKIGRRLLKPTVIYVPAIRQLKKHVSIKGLAHITGGGFYDNIPRVFPEGAGALIYRSAWPQPKLFKLIRKKAGISEYEMFRTFNMGIGMAAVIDRKDVRKTQLILKKAGIKNWVIGEVLKGRGVVIQ